MPESTSPQPGRPTSRKGTAPGTESKTRSERRAERRAAEEAGIPEGGPLPTWYRVIMFGLMIVGLLWIVAYYLTMGLAPIPQAGGWNIGIGFGIACVGFLMTTRWR